MPESPSHLVVGHVSRPHGTRGEVYVWPLTDHPEGVFAPGVVLRSAGEKGEEPDPDAPPLRVDTSREFQRGYLVRFGGFISRNDAERLRGLYLVRPIEELAALAEGEFFYHQLVGMRVRTVDGQDVGKVKEVYELAPADILEVRGPGGTVLVPFTQSIVRNVDVDEGIIEIDPPEGLLDL